MVAAPATALSACPPDPGSGTFHPDMAQRALELVNAHRAAHGLPELAVSPALQRAAEWKSGHMVAHGYFDHEDRGTGKDLRHRAASCGYPDGPVKPEAAGALAENIGVGYTSPEAATEGWVASEPHRRAIEDRAYTVTGVGVSEGPDGSIRWTQLFGDAGPPAPDARAARAKAPGGVDVSGAPGLLTGDGGPLGVSASAAGIGAAPALPVVTVNLGRRRVTRVAPPALPAAGVRLRVLAAPRGLRVLVRGRALEVRRRLAVTRGGNVVYEARREGGAPARGVLRVVALPLTSIRG